jgi:uncharacterized membrane protein YcaP (DUF421 family)
MEIIQNIYLKILVSSVLVYLFIVLMIRIFGKKELAQLSVVDLVFILLISNAVQNAMVAGDNSLLGGLIAAAALFSLNFLFKYLQYRFPRFSRMVQGSEIMLVYHGKVIDQHMRQAQVSTNELLEAIREHGVSSVTQVDLAILEVDGNISILSHEFSKKTAHRRKSHKVIKKEI